MNQKEFAKELCKVIKTGGKIGFAQYSSEVDTLVVFDFDKGMIKVSSSSPALNPISEIFKKYLVEGQGEILLEGRNFDLALYLTLIIDAKGDTIIFRDRVKIAFILKTEKGNQYYFN